MTLRPQSILTLVMLAIFSTMTAIALTYPGEAALMPLLVGIPGTILCCVQLASEVFAQPSAAEAIAAAGPDRRERIRAEMVMFLWIFAFLAGILAFGFVYAAPVLVFGFISLGRKEKLIYGLFGAIGTFAILYGVFDRLLGLPLFPGLLGLRLF